MTLVTCQALRGRMHSFLAAKRQRVVGGHHWFRDLRRSLEHLFWLHIYGSVEKIRPNNFVRQHVEKYRELGILEAQPKNDVGFRKRSRVSQATDVNPKELKRILWEPEAHSNLEFRVAMAILGFPNVLRLDLLEQKRFLAGWLNLSPELMTCCSS